jgi:V/A-type H+-transporting ATPase subunit I
VPRLAPQPPDLDAWARAGRTDLLAGEAQLEEHAADAVTRGSVSALLGWTPVAALPALADRLAPVGAAAAQLARPRGVDPPTAARPGALRRGFSPLVRTYAAVPYVDLDPTLPAGLAYVVMFGAMFGDVGHGGLLVLAAVAIRLGLAPRLRRYWLFLLGAGLSSALFGLGYGECFGPTGLVPTWWLAPVARPVPLLVGGIGLGALLLAGAYLVGTVNRVREGGWSLALYAPSGLAGGALFLAAGLAVTGLLAHLPWLWYAGLVLALLALVLVYAGLLATTGYRPAGLLQATIELFDTVIRLGANVVSFARLAAFGLTHAVLGWIVWDATVGLWRRGWLGAVVAVLVFALGNALAFGLEALVAGVQALRLAYYELFSRVFVVEGRPFRPWHLELSTVEGTEESWH